jgi:TonB family protein
MYARLFSTVAVVMSATLASALAQVDENGQPIQYLSARWVLIAWKREVSAHVLDNVRHYLAGREGLVVFENIRAGREGLVRIRFVLNRAGHIVSAKVEKSSGDAVLDKAALAMVRQADPVPLPPPSITEQQLIVNVPIDFRK